MVRSVAAIALGDFWGRICTQPEAAGVWQPIAHRQRQGSELRRMNEQPRDWAHLSKARNSPAVKMNKKRGRYRYDPVLCSLPEPEPNLLLSPVLRRNGPMRTTTLSIIDVGMGRAI